MVKFQPLKWREIVKVLMDAKGVVETVDEDVISLRCLLTGAKTGEHTELQTI